MTTRRAVLAGGAAALAGGAALVLTRQTTARDPLRSAHVFRSAARRTDVRYVVVRPRGGGPVPVLVVLHGRGGSASSVVDLDARGALDATGARLAVVGVDGGDHSYWHARRDGTDAGRMVTEELLPRLAADGLDVRRPALYGFSMGGFGALHLAATGLRGRVSSVATASAALWEQAGATAPGAFDDADDYRRTDVYAARPLLAGVPLRLDCGTDDPFYAANRAFRAGLAPSPEGAFQPGRGHDMGYWRELFPDAVRHAARHA